MADNLESYFKKHLSDDTPAKDNWNVPSDAVWEKALPAIQKKRGLLIPWKYVYLIGALIAIGSIVLLWQIDLTNTTIEKELPSATGQNEQTSISNNIHSEINETSKNKNQESTPKTKTISTSETQYNLLDASVQTTQNSTESDQTVPINNTVPEIKTENQSSEILGKGNENNQAATSAGTTVGTGRSTDQQYSVNAANKYTFDENSLVKEHEILSQKTISNVAVALDFTPIEKKSNFNISVEMEEERKQLEPINNKGKFGVGVYFLPTFTTTYLTGDLNTGILETSNMYLYSNNWGLELRYNLSNRFTLVAGIGQSEVRSWSKSLVDFDYDSSNEHIMDTGEKENTSDVPMPTPFGEIGTEITYRFPAEDNIPDGEIMQSELETHQEVRYLAIPLGVEFNIIRFSRFSWFAETGIRYNRALKDAASFTSRILHDGHDMDVVEEEMMGHPTYKESYLDLYLGTGINYQFTKHLQVSGSARYFNSITNVNLQDNMSTHVRGFNIKIGITYIF